MSNSVEEQAERRGFEKAQKEALDLLEKEIEKTKANGDLQTAEVFELIRAKLTKLSFSNLLGDQRVDHDATKAE